LCDAQRPQTKQRRCNHSGSDLPDAHALPFPRLFV
jgi:hypothetical protein